MAGRALTLLCFVVPAAHAEDAVRRLHRDGLLDPARKIRREGAEVWIAIRDAPPMSAPFSDWGARIAADDAPLAREPARTPRERVLALLPAALHDEVPDKWERHGDVLVLRLPGPHAREIARAFADALALRAVVHDPAGVAGELREMQGALLVGDDAEALHVENGVRYHFDAARIMFASGNLAERMRAARIPARGETVVDMFAGIGYFTLPLAMHAAPAKIVAIEKNPLSFRYLQRNAEENGVAGIVEPWLGDNREYPREGIADRVLMGYFPGTDAFLPKAMRLLKPEGGVLHFHNTAHERTWRAELTRQLLDAARACGTVVSIEDARVVKSHSPGVVHAVLQARARR